MSYIGNTPAENYASFLTETFSVSATANYTLSHAVSNENDIRLVINGVVQQPGSGKAYTANGTTLTLTSATASGDVMYAVYLGRALQTVNPPNASVGSAQVADSLISGKTALGATPADTDELLISDAGTLKRVDFSHLKSANTPAFKARLSSDQTIANVTNSVIACNTEKFDLGGCYNNTGSTVTLNGISTPAYSFAPNVAGKYFVYGGARFDNASGSGTLAYVLLIKNSANSFIGIRDFVPYGSFFVGGIVEMNGSSDTVNLNVYQNTGSSKIIQGASSDNDDIANFGAYKIIE